MLAARLRRPAVRPPRRRAESEGDPNRWLARASGTPRRRHFLQTRADVDPQRIGGIGLSVGGEIMIEAAAESTALKAIVSEGAGIRLGEGLEKKRRRLRPREAALGTDEHRDDRCRDGLLEPRAPAADLGSHRLDCASFGPADLRRPRHGRREYEAGGLLHSRPAAEGDVESAGCEAHRRPRRAAGRVRAARGCVLRPSAPGAQVRCRTHRARSGCGIRVPPDVGVAARRQAQTMPRYLLHHRHEPRECGVVFAAFRGYDSSLRHQSTLASCISGGHAIWWTVEAATEQAALALLPFYVAERTSASRVSEVEIP